MHQRFNDEPRSRPGTIANADGDIWTTPTATIANGKILIPEEMADEAERFGWRRLPCSAAGYARLER